tara:strand:+ start:1428 stop:1601 length:174 start_codon:yes stop_codon:yes gene_type:complete
METLGLLLVGSLYMVMGSFLTILWQDRHIWKKEYVSQEEVEHLEERADAWANEQPWK